MFPERSEKAVSQINMCVKELGSLLPSLFDPWQDTGSILVLRWTLNTNLQLQPLTSNPYQLADLCPHDLCRIDHRKALGYVSNLISEGMCHLLGS